jgi:phosphoglycolate phosphatase-like HAD superfamily hydrolase
VKLTNIEQSIHHKINSKTVLFFDLDGTLVDTNLSNFLSYQQAIQNVTKTDRIVALSDERFNRTAIKILFPDLNEKEYEEIIFQKEKNYIKQLHRTKVNNLVKDLLSRYHSTNRTILVTHCREERAVQTLNYHNLTNKFSDLFFRQTSENGIKINKYENAIKKLNLKKDNIVIFENE